MDWVIAGLLLGTTSIPLLDKAWTQLVEQQGLGLFPKSRLNAATSFGKERDSIFSDRRFITSLASIYFALFTRENEILGYAGNLKRSLNF